MQVAAALKERIKNVLIEAIAKAERHYNITIPMPTVLYTQRGTTAGIADYSKWLVKFNPVLLNENVEKFIARTVPHELAHLITHKVYPQAYETEIIRTRTGYRRTKRDVHGSYWQDVMRTLGVADIKRCHDYDVSNARTGKALNRHAYVCSGCGAKLSLTPAKHRALQANPDSLWHKGCRGSALMPDASQPAPRAAQPVAARVPAPAAPATGTKLDRCYGWYVHYRDANTPNLRQMCIAVFMQEVGMTKAGASTYYNTCTKMRPNC